MEQSRKDAWKVLYEKNIGEILVGIMVTPWMELMKLKKKKWENSNMNIWENPRRIICINASYLVLN